MRPIQLLFALAGAAVLMGAPMQALANHCVAPIEWGEGFAYETDYAGKISNPGSVLTIVSTVNCFSGIFGVIGDPDGSKEYSVIVTGGTSLGTTVTNVPGPNYKIHQTTYLGATFQIYEDPSNNANFATAPGSFTDGTLFLDGTIDSIFVTFTLTSTGAFFGGNFDAHDTGVLTGGSFFDSFGSPGSICQMNITGGWNPNALDIPPGWSADVAGKVDLADCVTQNESSTWGRLKALYH
ncbi:MAG TPA: hypothetical protein VJB15_07135 [Rhodothermia bacterium]|nr:hypothetical protein [Rhodothermia bacterium]